MSMLKSHSLLPKIAMLFFDIIIISSSSSTLSPDIGVSRAGSQLKTSPPRILPDIFIRCVMSKHLPRRLLLFEWLLCKTESNCITALTGVNWDIYHLLTRITLHLLLQQGISRGRNFLELSSNCTGLQSNFN